MEYELHLIGKAEDPAKYAKDASEGLILGYPVKIKGQAHRPDNQVPYHSTIKYFDKDKDHPHQIHHIARHLPLNPPDAKNTQIKFNQFKDRFGNDVNVVTLHGNSADKLKEHNGKFAGHGFPSKFEWTPHVSLDRKTWEDMKNSGAKTAHEAGIEFGSAELKKGHKTLKTYHHHPDTTEPVSPDESDYTAKIAVNKSELPLEKGALKNAALGMGMAAALAGATNHAATPKNTPDMQARQSYDHSKMLRAIASVESSGGKNTNHAAGGGAIHGSEHAYGRYGLMPQTIREVVGAHKDLKSKHAKLLALKGQNLHQYMQDHKGLEDTVADRHLSHLEHVVGQDPSHLGYGWLNGAQGTLNAKKQGKDINSHWHAKKVSEAYGKEK